MKNHGTPCPCTNGQFATISSRLIVALPRALQLSELDVKSVLRHTDEGERLSFALAEALKMLYNGNVATVLPQRFIERLSTTIAVPAVANFVASEHFVIDTSKKAKVKISYLEDNLKQYFLPKVESEAVGVVELAINKLLERAYNPAIITALGGQVMVEITLGQFFAAFAMQPNGEKGALLTDGQANIGYISDINGDLWAVGGYWNDGGWVFGANGFYDQNPWRSGYQFLSR